MIENQKWANTRDWATLGMRNPYLLFLAIAIILVSGFSAYRSMPRLEDPIITNRNPLILTTFPGASAQRVEALVTEKIEEKLQEIPEIKELVTTSRAGISLVAVELAENVTKKNNETIFAQIRDKLQEAARELPPGASTPLFDDQRGAVAYSLLIAISTPEKGVVSRNILNRLSEELADRLRRIPGTEIVRLFGEPREEITISVDPLQIAALGWSPQRLAARIRAADSKISAGTFRNEQRDLLLEVAGELDSTERIAAIPLTDNSNAGLVRLGEVAQIERKWREPPQSIARADGHPAVFVGALVQEEFRVDEWMRSASKIVADFSENLGEGIMLEIVFNQNQYTSERLSELTNNLLLGALVVLAVVFFTMGWRSSLFVGSSLPLTFSLSLFLIAGTGGKLHQMSIFGLIIALGLLIDNAIVVTDETNRRLRRGIAPLEAVRGALQHLFAPLLSSTLTTILAFMPILLLPGNAGDFVRSIGGSVIIALAGSFFIAMTIVASLTGKYGYRGEASTQDKTSWWDRGLSSARLAKWGRTALSTALTHPKKSILAAVAICLSGFFIATTMGVQFFPPTDRNMFSLRLWLPSQASIQETEAISHRIETILRQQPTIERIDWLVGGSFPPVYYNLIQRQDNNSSFAQAIVTTSDDRILKTLIPEMQKRLDAEFPQTQIVINSFAQGPPAEADIEYRLYGPDITTLQNLGEAVRLHLAEHPQILHTQVTMERGVPKVWVEANEVEAELVGLTLADIAQQLQGNLEGFTAGTVLEDRQELPVRLRYPTANRQNWEDINSMLLVSNSKGWVPLPHLGEMQIAPVVATITRQDSERTNIVRGYTRYGALPIDVTNDVLSAIQQIELPPGYHLEVGGESENQAEAVGNLLLYLPVLITLMLATIILSFRSLTLAAMLSAVAFLSIGIGLIATWFSGFPLSFNTMLGSMGLVGLAFNSSIVVLAGIRADPRARRGNPDAIVNEVLDCSRHLISTTLTTMGGFLPLLIFVGGDFWPPLAIVLAGGVGGSTLLAMIFTPALYHLLYRRTLTQG